MRTKHAYPYLAKKGKIICMRFPPILKFEFAGLSFCTCLCIAVFSGCAIKFQDRNDVVHLIGFGHMKMKVPPANEGVKAVVYGTETIGLTAGKTVAGHHVSLGWHDIEQLDILEENSSFRFERLESSLFNIDVGTEPPKTLIQKTREELPK